MRYGQKNIERKKRFKEFLHGVIMSFALCFMLFLYAPLEMYINNKNEFWFDIYKLFPIMLVIFLLSTIVCVAVLALCYFIHRGLYQSTLVVCFISFVALYVQGNFLVSNLPPLDGTMIDWNQYGSETAKSFILWIIVILLVLALIRRIHMQKFYQVVSFTGICMTLILLVTLITICISNEGYKKKLNICATNEKKFEMSTDTNFIILLLDAVDARALTALMGSEPKNQILFSDFTYYPNTVCAYPFTKHSIPFIFSGDWYENDEPFEEYNINAYKNSTLFSSLEELNYHMGMYETEIPLYDESICRFENIKNDIGEFKSLYTVATLEIKLVGFKYAPFGLKKYCSFDINWLNGLRVENDYSIFNASDIEFYNEVNNTDITYTDDKCFKFIHLDGAHVPFQYDKNMNIIENGTYEEEIEACMTLTKAYFDKLQKAGVYDNSVIIVMADHGFNGESGDVERETFGRHNPILLVKGVHERHDLHISNAPISYADLQEAFLRLLNGMDSAKIFDWREGDQRERRFLFYYYLGDDHMVEYMQTGHADDIDTTGREFNYER